jgi:hypothetical protein
MMIIVGTSMPRSRRSGSELPVNSGTLRYPPECGEVGLTVMIRLDHGYPCSCCLSCYFYVGFLPPYRSQLLRMKCNIPGPRGHKLKESKKTCAYVSNAESYVFVSSGSCEFGCRLVSSTLRQYSQLECDNTIVGIL